MENVEKLDIKETIISNVLWLMFGGLLIYVVIMLIQMASRFQTQELQLLALIIVCFTSIKLLMWIGHPTLVFKLNDGGKLVSN